MKHKHTEFDMSHLKNIVDTKFGCAPFAMRIGVSEGRLAELLAGESIFKMDEMISCALLLELDNEEFERCFFTAKSSEFLNLSNNKQEVRE